MSEERLRKRVQREKKARMEAEKILEDKSRELYERNTQLKELSENLEKQVVQRTQDLKVAHDKALSAVKAKSEFIANMSHEIRTPLNGVLGMLTMTLDTQLTEKQKKWIGNAFNSGQHLLSVVNDILDFSKIEAGKMVIQMEATDVISLTRGTVSGLRSIAKEKGIELACQFPKQFPSYIDADPLRFRQILTNLISNALKFTSEGSVNVSIKQTQERYTLKVEDAGIGMSEKQIGRIFNAFGQADGSITRQFGGTGLGLTITQYFIDMMGGNITVSSEKGRGSCFIVELPLVEQDALSKEQQLRAVSADGRFESAEVLLVEDLIVNQEIAEYLLNRANLKVDIANNGKEAIEAIEKKDYSVVLMDLQMPVLGGIEATEIIRKKYSKEKLPIIAMTAHATKEHKDEVLSKGMNDHVSKPIETSELYRALAAFLTFEQDKELKDKNKEPATEKQQVPTSDTQNYAGLDIVQGLARVSGKTGFYCRLLRSFHDSYQKYSANLKRHLSAQEWDESIAVLHALRGSSLNISANELAEHTSTFERTLRDASYDNVLELESKLFKLGEQVESSLLEYLAQHQ
jgi:signal transduction histidine kinase/CheY-like chemotaxis protein/HPt (histidine-containing phosphotransfer) domain-containing protein